MDEKASRRLAELCARCCANRELAKCGQCRMYKCKMVRTSTVEKKKQSSSSSHAPAQQSSQRDVHSASPHGSVQSAEPSARANDSGGSSGNASGRSKPDAAQSSVRKTASKKSSVVDAVAASQSAPAKSSSKNAPQSAVESPPINFSEQPVPPVQPPTVDPDGFGQGNGESANALGIVVDGWDVAKYHNRKGFRSVNVVRAIKFLRKCKYKSVVAFVPGSYVDLSKGKKLADDPCALKHVKERGFLQFTEDKRLYAWHMLTFAKKNQYAIITNRWFHEHKVKTPEDVEVSPEELNELCAYARDRRMPYTFKKSEVFDLKNIESN